MLSTLSFSTDNHHPNHPPSLQRHPHLLPPPLHTPTTTIVWQCHITSPLAQTVSDGDDVSATLLMATWQPIHTNNEDNEWTTWTTTNEWWGRWTAMMGGNNVAHHPDGDDTGGRHYMHCEHQNFLPSLFTSTCLYSPPHHRLALHCVESSTPWNQVMTWQWMTTVGRCHWTHLHCVTLPSTTVVPHTLPC